MFGTNPLTMAAPSSGDHPLTADMATSNGAYGKIMAAKNEGVSIPEGWAVGQGGTPTTDPAEAMAGALLPFAGHKGSAIAALLEVFAASLGHGAYSYQTKSIWNYPDFRMNTSHLIISIDTDAFTSRHFTEEKVCQLQEEIRGSAPEPAKVYAPGDPEREKEATNATEVAIIGSTIKQLRGLASSLSLAWPPQSRQERVD